MAGTIAIVPVDAGRLHLSDNAQRNSMNFGGSPMKIDSLCVDLGVLKEKGDEAKCKHFSIRGYVESFRQREAVNCLPFDDGGRNHIVDLPPMDVPRFKYWRCRGCVREFDSAAHESTLVSECIQSVVKPPALPFGEGSSGLTPAEKGNDDDSFPSALREHSTHPSPCNVELEKNSAKQHQGAIEIPPNVSVPQESAVISAVDANATENANIVAPDMKESNGFIDVENAGTDEDPQTSETFETIQSDDDSSGNPPRKRRVRLLTELLCENSEDQQQKKDNSPPDSGPSSSSPSTASHQGKRKQSSDQDRKTLDVSSPSFVGKKVKAYKRDAAPKTAAVEESGASGASKVVQKSSTVSKGTAEATMEWRSIFSDVRRAGKPASIGNSGSRPDHDLPKSRVDSNRTPPPLADKKCSATSKKRAQSSQRSRFFTEDFTQQGQEVGSRSGDLRPDADLGLSLSLKYDPQAEAMPKRINDKSRQSTSLGESSIPVRVSSTLTPPRTAPLQEQRHYCPQLSHGSLPPHKKMDFSVPSNKRTNGVRGYSDVMRTHNHQRQEKIFPNGRTDEMEIVELMSNMSKYQHERSMREARYYLPGGSNSGGISSPSSYLKASLNEGMPKPPTQEYPSMRKPSSRDSTISIIPTGEKVGPTVRSPAGFFHQERIPSFALFDAFSHGQQQLSSGIRFSDFGAHGHHNSRFRESNGSNKIGHWSASPNTQVLETFNKFHNGMQQHEAAGTVWSTIPASLPFGSKVEMHGKNSDKNRGKSIMDLDLNLVAPIMPEEQHKNPDLESLGRTSTEYRPSVTIDKRVEFDPKQIVSLDSKYSNEAIPAMQLLSLMDAGKSSSPFSLDRRNFPAKPFAPCYEHPGFGIAGKLNPPENSHFPYSGLRPVVHKPVESSRNFLSAQRISPSLTAAGSFPSLFQTDRNVKGPAGYVNHVFHKPQENPRASQSCNGRPEDSFVFPLPWHATEDRNANVNTVAQGALVLRDVPPGTEVCTTNQNPADFSTPGPGNTYMISGEDLVLKGNASYKGKSPSETFDGRKRQRIVRFADELPQRTN